MGAHPPSQDAGVPYRILHEPVGDDRRCDRHQQPDHILAEGQTCLSSGFCREDEDRPMPQVQRVGKPAHPSKRPQSKDLIPPPASGCACAPPAITRAGSQRLALTTAVPGICRVGTEERRPRRPIAHQVRPTVQHPVRRPRARRRSHGSARRRSSAPSATFPGSGERRESTRPLSGLCSSERPRC